MKSTKPRKQWSFMSQPILLWLDMAMVNHGWHKMAQDFMPNTVWIVKPFTTGNFPKKCQLTIIDRDIFWSLLRPKRGKTNHHIGYCSWCQVNSFASAVLDKIFLAYQSPLFSNIYINVLKKFCFPGRQLATCMLARWVTPLALDYQTVLLLFLQSLLWIKEWSMTPQHRQGTTQSVCWRRPNTDFLWEVGSQNLADSLRTFYCALLWLWRGQINTGQEW